MKLKLKESIIFFVNSSPKAIVHLVQKTLFTYLTNKTANYT